MKSMVAMAGVVWLLASGVHAQAPAGTPKVLVWVTAPMRDGFVDTSREIQDSVNDIRKALEDEKTLEVAEGPKTADLLLTVVARGTGSQLYGERTQMTHYYGSTQIESLPVVANTRWISTVMEIGTYKKEFAAAYTNASTSSMGAWTDDAKNIVKDLRAWVSANDANIRSKRKK
jgi:hypothetical protein